MNKSKKKHTLKSGANDCEESDYLKWRYTIDRWRFVGAKSEHASPYPGSFQQIYAV